MARHPEHLFDKPILVAGAVKVFILICKSYICLEELFISYVTKRGGGHSGLFVQFCAFSKVPMVLIKGNIYLYHTIGCIPILCKFILNVRVSRLKIDLN